MTFDSLTDKLNSIFSKLSGKGKLTESDVKSAMREVKMALLEADVNFKVVKQFVSSVQERAVGEEVMNGLNPAQMVIKIVNEEMTSLMGSETTELQLQPGDKIYLYTDGVTEATNLQQELYGEERLLQVLNRYADADPRTVCEAVKADVDVFVGEAEQFDDITMLCITYLGEQQKESK